MIHIHCGHTIEGPPYHLPPLLIVSWDSTIQSNATFHSNHNQVKEETARLKAKHEGKVLIAGLDPCQRLSGIALKLLAFERLLTEYECYRDKVRTHTHRPSDGISRNEWRGMDFIFIPTPINLSRLFEKNNRW